jgi:LAGLIDADG DNA endonuclease family
MVLYKRTFYTSRLGSEKRIGPHNQDVISTIVGNLLGDGFAEKRNNATRFHIHMSSKNADYIFSLHLFFAQKGYCSLEKPKVKKQIGKNNRVYYSIKFRTFSFRSLNYLYDAFYENQIKLQTQNLEKRWNVYKKVIPENICNLLTEKAFAIWFMDDGGKTNQGYKISTESFSYKHHIILQQAIFQKFNVQCSIQKHKQKFILYFKKKDKEKLSKIIKPHMYTSMYYKID